MNTLTKQQKDRACALGRSDCQGLVAEIKARVLSFDTPEEKVLWWAVFLGNMDDICAAMLGAHAPAAIKQVTAKIHRERLM